MEGRSVEGWNVGGEWKGLSGRVEWERAEGEWEGRSVKGGMWEGGMRESGGAEC